MQPIRSQRLHVAVGLFAAALLGSSPYPGGCGSNVQESKPKERVALNQSCDVSMNGQLPPGCEGNDPGEDVPMGEPSSSCPSDYPLGCGAVCCPAGYPACCLDNIWCGTTPEACDEVDNPGGGNDGSGSASGGGSTICSNTQGGGCVSIEFCANTATNQCWYTVNGQQFTCASCSDINGCFQQATDAGVQACGG